MIQRLLLLVLLAQVLALAGCATPPARPVPADVNAAWQQRLSQLSALGKWDLRARIAVRVGDDGGQASLHWQHQDQGNDMRLAGAWGKGLLRLSFDRDTAQLTDEYGQTVSGPDAAVLLYRATGWVIPVSSLNSWMAGRPVGDQAQTKLDRYGRLQQMTEEGWRIEYQEYQQVGRWELPRRMKLSQLAEVDGQRLVTLRLVVSQWQVGG